MGSERMAGTQLLERRMRLRRAGVAGSFLLFAVLLVTPGGARDGDRVIGPAEAELPTCFGRACPDPGPVGWTARLEVLFEGRAPDMPEELRRRVARAVVEESRAAGLDPLLTAAIIDVESGYDAGARSWAGARGLMQVLPSTMAAEAARNGLAAGDPHDPVVNVRVGIRYFHRLVDTFVRKDWALMAYNAGPNRIGGYLLQGRIPPELRVYPGRVFAEQRRLRQQFGIEPAPALADARAAALVQ